MHGEPGEGGYPTRATRAFPARRPLQSLRVVLGEGEGQTGGGGIPAAVLWAAEEPLQSVMSPGEAALITGQEGYELRFKVVELWGKLTARLAK